MAKWRRTVLGHAYDPTPDLDIHWSDEYASDDRDSEDLHSEPRSDDSDDDPTTDDDYEEPEPPLAFQEVVVEKPAGGDAGAAVPAGGDAGAAVPVVESQETGESAAVDPQASGEGAVGTSAAVVASDSDSIEWCE